MDLMVKKKRWGKETISKTISQKYIKEKYIRKKWWKKVMSEANQEL